MAEAALGSSPLTRCFPWWIIYGAVLLPCLYLPTLGTQFDFIDDGNLVYPEPPMPVGQRLARVWEKVAANYDHLGPFRPVLWAHWEAEAELFGARPFLWRLARMLWMMLATGMLLWLLRELGVGRWPALIATAMAMWNPYRNEIWTSLTLSEGVAMPYALLGMVCAIRAARSSRPLPWDIGGALGVLAALGCKNTFAALVPAQLILRIAADGSSLRLGWKRHGLRASLLSLTLVLPIIHFIGFRITWHPGQYVTHGPSLGQLERMLGVIHGAISLDFLGIGLALAVLAVCANAWVRRARTGSGRSSPLVDFMRAAFGPIWSSQRVPLLAALIQLAGGIAVYLPLDMVSGRYSMPAVWGADICMALLLTRLGEVTAVTWRRLAYAGLAGGLAALAVANVGRQEKLAARARLLWQALEYVEREAPPETCLGWVSGPQLNEEEGIHFYWHLEARKRRDLFFRLLDADGKPELRRELAVVDGAPAWLLGATTDAPIGGMWKPVQEFASHYWFRTQVFRCYLLQKS